VAVRARADDSAHMFVRLEQTSDAAGIRAVHAAAFARPDLHPIEADLVDALRRAGDLIPALCFVAVDHAGVVGHVACSRGRIGSRNLPGLGPIGVLPSRQGQGVGHALMHAVLGAVEALGEPAVVLLGEPAFYGRFGFEPAERHGVRPQDPTWGTAFQLRRLTAWDPLIAGTFRYAPAFDAVA
jgi:putative acetyltransferase